MLINTTNGKYIRVDHIVSIDLKREDSETLGVVMRDGSAEEFEAWKLADVLEADTKIVDAPPGFQLLWFGANPEWDPATHNIETSIVRTSILGWRISGASLPLPITVQENDWQAGGDSSNSHDGIFIAVLDPVGTVLDSGDKTWNSITDWIAYVRAAWKAQLAQPEQGKVVPFPATPNNK